MDVSIKYCELLLIPRTTISELIIQLSRFSTASINLAFNQRNKQTRHKLRELLSLQNNVAFLTH